MHKILLSCLCVATLGVSAGSIPEYRILLSLTPESNLLRNPGFDRRDAAGNPEHWFFDNCTRNPLLLESREELDGNPVAMIRVADVDTPELYGYWGQSLTLPSAGKYEFRCRLRTEDMSFAYWLSNYDGSITALRMFSAASGERSREILGKFIDPEWLVTYHPAEWRPLGVDIEVPELSHDGFFTVKIGAMAASAGWMAVDDAWFGLLPLPVNVTVNGTGVTGLTIRRDSDTIATLALNPALAAQTVQIALPSGLERYFWEVSTSDKQTFRMDPEWQ